MDSIVRIPSVTGVDVELKIAGPGGRSYAFIIDWHIRFLAALAWLVAGSVIVSGPQVLSGGGYGDGATYLLAVVLPCAAIYFLYHPVLELAMQGQTPGKRMAGVRIVTLADGGAPAPAAILLRNVFRLVDALPSFYGVGLIVAILTKHGQRVGDIAAGTVLVYDDAPRHEMLEKVSGASVQRLGLAEAQLVRDVLDRWRSLAPGARAQLAAQLLEKQGITANPHADSDERLRAQLEALLA